jgi:hypothetical protein
LSGCDRTRSGYWRFHLNPILAFWAAYILTRPLGASFADWFSKPTNGGLNLGDGLVAAIELVIFIGLAAQNRLGQPDLIVFCACLCAPLCLRHRSPMLAFCLVALVCFVQWLVSGPRWQTRRCSSRCTGWRSTEAWPSRRWPPAWLGPARSWPPRAGLRRARCATGSA